MEADEAGTMNALKSGRDELINPPVALHNGRIVKLMGDGALTRNLTAGVASAAKFGTREQARLATLPARDTRKLRRSKHP